MSDVISAALILLIGVPLVLAGYFGYAFVRQAWRASRRNPRDPKSPPQ
jgi:ABC-type phosphate transport system permease subunit